MNRQRISVSSNHSFPGHPTRALSVKHNYAELPDQSDFTICIYVRIECKHKFKWTSYYGPSYVPTLLFMTPPPLLPRKWSPTFLPRAKCLFGNLTLLYQGRIRCLPLSFSVQLVERLGISENLRPKTSHHFAEIFEIEFLQLFISRPWIIGLAPVQLSEQIGTCNYLSEVHAKPWTFL